MAANLYVSTAEVLARIDAVNTTWSAAERSAMERIIEAVSRAADRYCGFPLRQFYKTAASTARVLTADDYDYLSIPDLTSTVVSVKTDADGDRTYGTTWATTDYDLLPENAAEYNEPYTHIQVTPKGTQGFPTHAKGVQITGTWGWPAVPPEVTEAVALEAVRRWQQMQAPAGASVNEALGRVMIEPGWHKTSLDYLARFRRAIFVGGA